METLEELRTITSRAPDDATHISDRDYYKFENLEWKRWAMVLDVQDWYTDIEPDGNIRSLSDIRFIINQMEAEEDLLEQIKDMYKESIDFGWD